MPKNGATLYVWPGREADARKIMVGSTVCSYCGPAWGCSVDPAILGFTFETCAECKKLMKNKNVFYECSCENQENAMDTRSLNERIAKALEWGYAGDTGEWGYLPNLAGDLNLMHELEAGLTKDEATAYWHELDEIVADSNKAGKLSLRVLHAIHATAEQKAKAWLKVKELREVEHDGNE